MQGGHGPEQMDMEKRLLMAMLLSMAVLLLIPFLYQRLGPPSPPAVVETREEQEVRATGRARTSPGERFPGNSPQQRALESNPGAGSQDSGRERRHGADLEQHWSPAGKRAA